MKSRLDYFLKYDGGIFAATGLKDILPSDIVSVINTLMRKKPYIKKASSKTTAERYRDLLSSVFEFAREERAYAYTNPRKSKSVKKAKDKEKRKEDGFVSDEEFERFTPNQLRHTYCSILYWSG